MLVTIRSLLDGRPVEVFPGLFIYTPPTREHFSGQSLIGDVLDESILNSPSLTHAGFGYSVAEDSFIDRAINAFGLWRLNHVHQLGFLQDPDTTPEDRPFQPRFMHTRFLHSLDVAALAATIVYNNQAFFTERPSYAKTMVLAALTHDVLTPAGGDTTKSIDFAAFDEDIGYPEVLGYPAVARFLRVEDIDGQLLAATIRNEGPLGSVLDLVDKLGYISRDTINFEGNRDTRIIPWDWRSPRRQIVSESTRTENLTGLWQSVKVDEDGVVITDSDHLYRFLYARALMFQHLYTAPEARYQESLIARTILSFLYDTGRLTRDWLLTRTDIELRREVGQLISERFFGYLVNYRATYRVFDTVDRACMFEGACLAKKRYFVQTEDVGRFFKPATHFRIETSAGVVPFIESAPQLAAKVLTAGRSTQPIRVYYLEGDQPKLNPTWKEEFELWRMEQFVRDRRSL